MEGFLTLYEINIIKAKRIRIKFQYKYTYFIFYLYNASVIAKTNFPYDE